jgi:putative hemolysin
MFGCTSFEGTSLSHYRGALAVFATRFHPLARAVAAETTPLLGPADEPGLPLPPLLRHYLSLGGQISADAVVDRDLNTMHVLTVLPIAAIPAQNAKALRRLAAEA